LQRPVGEFVGACKVVVEETVDTDRSVRRTSERGLDGLRIESMQVSGDASQGVREPCGEAGECGEGT
jgi:hypothetical protein